MKMNQLIPMLPVRSMPASVDFYCRMLGFDVETRNDDWGWAMLRFDECRLVCWYPNWTSPSTVSPSFD